MSNILIDTGVGWACSAANWADFEIMAMALHKKGGFNAMVWLVDDALDWTPDTPQLELLSSGSQIAVRGYRPDSKMNEFFGRHVESVSEQFVAIEENPEYEGEWFGEMVPDGLMLEPLEALHVLRQRMTGVADLPSTLLPRSS